MDSMHSLGAHLVPAVILLGVVVAAEATGHADRRGTNHLAGEKSPYLLQHAGNPVDWHPWGPEAFAKARAEDKPVFLSIGYSTCHWCHVMEKESFEDDAVAELLNDTFVCIKVDREERPDIDAVYMDAARVMSGGGGWPLTIVMTPDKQPFYAATYLPRTSRFGRPGMMELVPRIGELWDTRRDELVDTAGRVASTLREQSALPGGAKLGADALDEAYEQLRASFDSEQGGFGTAPKFPTPHQLLFLLRYWNRTGETDALAMVESTLRAMRRGGVYDQVGHGFHRYSTDAEWLLPHFEKMLYDQAMLVLASTEASLAGGDRTHRRTVDEVVSYVLRDMTSPEGGFYSAEDADSEGEEGLFYLWSIAELNEALGEKDAVFAASVWNA
ncbi:MAG TPA: thioredoxin domain-containing protein, partial [bacterium]|nr:thioredoxin domain-containing protein [bacterium]